MDDDARRSDLSEGAKDRKPEGGPDRAGRVESGDGREEQKGTSSSGLVVGVGAPAGGLEAFAELLRCLPDSAGMGFVLVQQPGPHRPSISAELLGNYTRMPVVQASGDVPVEPNHVYVIPPNATMLLGGGMLRVTRPAGELSREQRGEDAAPSSHLPQEPHRLQTILLIDDNAVVLQTTGAILEQGGYRVITADNGQAGVDLFRQEKDRVALIILDLTMPVMGGEQAFDFLRKIRNDVPILLTSGYDESEVGDTLAGRQFAGFIHKPSDADDLLEAVATVIRGGAKNQS